MKFSHWHGKQKCCAELCSPAFHLEVENFIIHHLKTNRMEFQVDENSRDWFICQYCLNKNIKISKKKLSAFMPQLEEKSFSCELFNDEMNCFENFTIEKKLGYQGTENETCSKKMINHIFKIKSNNL